LSAKANDALTQYMTSYSSSMV